VKKKENKFLINDFTNLSLLEVITLQMLQRHTKSVVRHTLYLEVNHFLETEEYKAKLAQGKISGSEAKYLEFLKEQKKISTSSFYNNLQNLESQGLLSFVKNKKGKVIAVKSNENTPEALKTIETHFLRTSMGLNYEDLLKGAQKLLKLIGKNNFTSILLIWLYEYVDNVLFKFLSSISESCFIVCYEELYNNSIKNNFPNFIYSEIYKDQIREPDNAFDLVVFMFMYVDKSIIGLTREEFLAEAVRVTEEGGNVVLANLAELPLTENKRTNELIRRYNNANQHQISNAQEFEDHFSGLDIKNYEIINNNSLILGLAWI